MTDEQKEAIRRIVFPFLASQIQMSILARGDDSVQQTLDTQGVIAAAGPLGLNHICIKASAETGVGYVTCMAAVDELAAELAEHLRSTPTARTSMRTAAEFVAAPPVPLADKLKEFYEIPEPEVDHPFSE